MAILAPVSSPASPAPVGADRRRRWVLPVLVLLVLVVAFALKARYDERMQRRPLEVVESASARAGMPVGLIGTREADEPDGPTEARVRSLAGPGDAFLEPVFLDGFGRHHAFDEPPAGSRCYFLAVQDGRGPFDAARASGIARFCYLDGDDLPVSTAVTSVG